MITQNPRISKCAVSQVDSESQRISSIKQSNKDVVKRVNSYNTNVLSQFTPGQREEDLNSKVKRSQTMTQGSIGVSRVVIENSVGDFNLQEPSSIPIRKISITNAPEMVHHVIKNINYCTLYKLATVIGVSVIGYCVYNDKDINQFIVNYSQRGIDILNQGIQNAIDLVYNYPTTFKFILVSSLILIVVFVTLAKRLRDLNNSNYNLIAENCIHRTEKKIRENAIPYLDVKYEIEHLCQEYDLTEEKFMTKVYPLMKEILEDHTTLEETNVYKDGFLKRIWKLK
jgi:hypothetical protein